MFKREREDVPDMPNISKALPIIKWASFLTVFYIRLLVKEKPVFLCHPRIG